MKCGVFYVILGNVWRWEERSQLLGCHFIERTWVSESDRPGCKSQWITYDLSKCSGLKVSVCNTKIICHLVLRVKYRNSLEIKAEGGARRNSGSLAMDDLLRTTGKFQFSVSLCLFLCGQPSSHLRSKPCFHGDECKVNISEKGKPRHPSLHPLTPSPLPQQKCFQRNASQSFREGPECFQSPLARLRCPALEVSNN